MKSNKVETVLGFLILCLLLVIAIGVLIKQSRYDEAPFTAALSKDLPARDDHDSAGPARDLRDYRPEGWVVMTPAERFGPESLSEKIDGRAELYLSAGFLSLRTQRFAVAGQPEQWLELFLYDMGDRRNAFSVYSTQRRADAEDVPLAQSAYRTENALFFQHGQFYVEMIGTSKQMVERMLAIGENFIREHPADADRIDELTLFPEASLVPGSLALLAENVFGFDRLSHTFTARYRLAETELTAFLAPQASATAAREMANAYHEFLTANGGEDVSLTVPIPDAWVVKVFDTFEVVFIHDSYLGGVHEAERKDLAEELTLKLKKALSQAGK